MATIIRLKGADFSGKGLPVIAPLVSRGLQGAWRPAGNEASLIDLSGNGATLTKVGNPTFTSNALRGNYANGYRTSIGDAPSITLIAAVRSIKDTNNADEQDGFAVGNYRPTSQGNRGSSIYIGKLTTNAETGVYDLKIRAQSYLTKIDAPTTTINRNLQVGIIHADIPATNNMVETDWAWAAYSLNAETGVIKGYYPQKYPSPALLTNETSLGNSIAGRFLTATDGVTPNFMEIVLSSASGGGFGGIIEVAEAMIYHTALTDDEVLTQYAYSKEFLANVRGIQI